MNRLLSLATLALVATPAAAQLGTPITLGPFGGPFQSVDVDPANPQNLLLSNVEKGLLRSTDGGNSFAPLQPLGLPVGPFQFVRRFERNPSNPAELFALLGSSAYRSTDGGLSWTDLAVPAGADLRWIAAQPGGNGLLASSSAEVWHSPDAGATWNLAFSGQTLGQVTFAPSDPSRAYLASFNGLRISTNGGASFAPAGADTTWLKGVAVAPNDPNTVFGGGLSGRIKKSTNAGATWTDTLLGTFASIEFFELDGVVPGRIWACLLDRLYTSDNLGASWVFASQGLPASQPIVTDLAFASNGNQYLSTEDGFFRAQGGVPPWTLIGLPNLPLFDAAIASPGGKRLVSNFRGVYASAGPLFPMAPTAWVFDFGAHTNQILVDPTNPDRWILGGVGAFIDNATVRIATNNGANIQTPLEYFGGGQVRALALDPIGQTEMLAGVFPNGFQQPGLSRSTNLGASWAPVPGTTSWGVVGVAYDPFVAGRIVVLDGLIPGNIRISTNGGTSWTTLPGWNPTAQPWLLRADPVRPGVFYGADEGVGLLRSVDGGVTWTSLGESAYERSDIAFHPSIPGLFWFSNADGRVRVTTDGGNSFADVFTVPEAPVAASGLALDASTGGLLVATGGNSAWEVFFASPYVDLGGASAGAGGVTPRQVPSGPLAQVGNAGFALGAERFVGGAPVLLHIGLANLSLPFAGGVLGTFEPTVFQAALLASGAPGAPGAGSVSQPLPIPAVPSLAGLELYSQFFGFDTASPFVIVLSNALRVRLLP